MQARLLGLFTTMLFGLVARHAGADGAPRVHFVGRISSGQTLVADSPSGRRTLLALPPWAGPEQLVVSPSGKHAFTFVLLEAHKPRTGYVVDLDVGAVSGSFRPGVGGSFVFSPTDTLIQITGCGTSCASLTFHDTRGKSFGQYSCDGFDTSRELSRDHRYAACLGTRHLDIVDTTTGKPVVSANTPCRHVGQREGTKYLSGSAFRFVCMDDHDRDVEVRASWAVDPPSITTHRR